MCPLCGTRRARRTCPALGQQICAICCGTKRLVEINCPSDCVYLTTAREHPPAVAVRQQQQDLGVLFESLRDLGERQAQLFFLVTGFLLRYEPPALQSLIDNDVADAAAALASTFETAARGLVYDHRATSPPADRLATALKAVIVEAGKTGGTAFERDAATVLRRVEQAARRAGQAVPSNDRAFLDFLKRITKRSTPGITGGDAGDPPADDTPPRLIVP